MVYVILFERLVRRVNVLFSLNYNCETVITLRWRIFSIVPLD